ncbi:pentapeptide repeat-containing protein [Streptomyces sp. NPDC048172]|uniref:pentapeptide repeat-containing protein n=1 Tax=Streptomyces sp. NPDC048172 TaxID=3365505 RepID=UPI0037204F67
MDEGMGATPWERCRSAGECRGVVIADGSCLAHLHESVRGPYLDGMSPGADVDLRGTRLGAWLLGRVLDAVRDEAGTARFGAAAFDDASFAADAEFRAAVFEDHARFVRATFHGFADFSRTEFGAYASFVGTVFREDASFDGARFGDWAGFAEAEFADGAWFEDVAFEGDCSFRRAAVRGDARFDRAGFAGETGFDDAVLARRALFRGAAFRGRLSLGPLVCGESLVLDSATVAGPTTFEVSARRVSAARTRFEEPVTLDARHATLDLSGALLLHPCTVSTAVSNERTRRAEEELLADAATPDGLISVSSLRGVDASMVLLAGVDLTTCAFSGTHHLDQLRLEGKWRLGTTPRGLRWSRGVPRWCAQRQVIEEERQWRTHPWRATRTRHDWGPPPSDPGTVPSLSALMTTYRQLRKAREDAKDEPGAADFYYGEMEMRRYARPWRNAERWLLQAYWALSGYGLRASRALGWLAGAMLVTVLLMMAVGLPDTPGRPYPASSGVVGTQAPTLHRPFADRFTAARAERAADVVLNSVVFRASGQQLTLPGRYVEKTARFAEPTLIGLAALAIRGRLKRG